MQLNKIVELNLETRAKELRDKGKTEEQISKTLSESAHQTITRSSVHRYFAAQVRMSKEVIEKNDRLKAKVVEAEIDTITRRNKIIDRLERLADKAEKDGVDKTVIEALKTQIAALDSLDKRLGRFTEKPEVTNQFLIIQAPELRKVMKELDEERNCITEKT